MVRTVFEKGILPEISPEKVKVFDYPCIRDSIGMTDREKRLFLDYLDPRSNGSLCTLESEDIETIIEDALSDGEEVDHELVSILEKVLLKCVGTDFEGQLYSQPIMIHVWW